MTILLPHVMEYNLERLGGLYGCLLLAIAGPEVYAVTPAAERASKAIAVVREMTRQLNQACGLPMRLRDVGVTEADLPKIARTALNDGALLLNPKEAGRDDVMQILQKAY
jgi:alcohol dehydrogenase